MIFWEIKPITCGPIQKRLIGETFMHAIAIKTPFLLVNYAVWGHYIIKNVWMKSVFDKIKVKGNGRMAAFDFRFPTEFHVGGHARSRLDKGQRNRLFYFHVRQSSVQQLINFLLFLSRSALIPN